MEKEFKDYQVENAALKAELSELRQKLDKELEWKPSRRTGTQMDQKRYEELLHCTLDNGFSRVMSEEEVKELLFEECGFSPDKIEIVTKVAAYEVNKYRQLSTIGSLFTAPPIGIIFGLTAKALCGNLSMESWNLTVAERHKKAPGRENTGGTGGTTKVELTSNEKLYWLP